MRIALASSSGEEVDLHFGRASRFLVYEYTEGEPRFLESRTVDISETGKHQWMKALDAIRDCDVVIAVQAGLKGKIGIEDAGIKFVADEGPVEEVLDRWIRHTEFMKSL
ncbi:FeMo cofactor biosynthesis protein [Methanothermobacter thermautotrophicus]|uniref:FeMo cofactor biosynthesis protein n=2 Tax=Methanothermobacter thermautotrophicus TaxID=145262 RepID=A0A842YNY6_METTF|nr:FeMo cofactor biosynthesis protein [Methanothermobacter thermautotrophicus]